MDIELALANGRPLSAALLASDTSIEPALEPVQLFECIGEGGCDFGGRFAVQTLCLDQPSTCRGFRERASKVPSGLGVIVGVLPTGCVTSCNREPSELDVVHDHVRLGEYEIGCARRPYPSGLSKHG